MEAPPESLRLRPAMTPREEELYSSHLKGAASLVEYGSGGSTALAARLGIPRVFSVESDRNWLVRLEEDADVAEAVAAGRIELHHVDIGATGDWGVPVDRSGESRWSNYPAAPWPRDVDLVLVDGRFRVACTLAAVSSARPDARIVIHDFFNRPQYHVVLDYLECLDRCETLGVFTIKPGAVVPEPLYARFVLDPA